MSLARVLMTASSPFYLGTVPMLSYSSAATSGTMVVALDNPATKAGTVTSVTAVSSGGGTAYFCTGTITGTGGGTFTVRSVSSLITLGGGTSPYTFSVSLATQPGDYIAIYGSSASPGVNTSAGNYRQSFGSATPVPGQTYSLINIAGRALVQGTAF